MFPSTRRTIQSNTGLGQLGGGGDGGSAYGEITLTSQTRIFRWMEENCDLTSKSRYILAHSLIHFYLRN